LRAKGKRVIKQFAPHDFTAFKWEGAKDFLHYMTTILLLAVFLLAELNPFYLKASYTPPCVPMFTTITADNLHLIRHSCGWSRITRSSSAGWYLCAFALFPPSVNSMSTSALQSKHALVYYPQAALLLAILLLNIPASF
jgi:4-amino-4-deoxy-L-arabinose transferase-like glycosyltransferase